MQQSVFTLSVSTFEFNSCIKHIMEYNTLYVVDTGRCVRLELQIFSDEVLSNCRTL